jgi:hypothetical protein
MEERGRERSLKTRRSSDPREELDGSLTLRRNLISTRPSFSQVSRDGHKQTSERHENSVSIHEVSEGHGFSHEDM